MTASNEQARSAPRFCAKLRNRGAEPFRSYPIRSANSIEYPPHLHSRAYACDFLRRRAKFRALAIATLAVLGLTAFTLSAHPRALAATPDELTSQIEEKSRELREITNQMNAVQNKLDETSSQGLTLARELKTVETNVRQLDLGIRAGKITVQKLELEIENLSYDLGETREKVGEKRRALAELMQEIQKKDRTSDTLSIFLTQKSFAESFLEAQSIANLQDSLLVEVEGLKTLTDHLGGTLKATEAKKSEIEAERAHMANRKAIAEDQKVYREKLLKETKNQERVYQETLAALSKRQAEIADEVEEIESELRRKIDPSALPRARPGVFTLPASGAISQDYGETAFAKYGYRGKFHNGIDIAGPIGTSVVAAEDGTVIASGDQDRYCPRGAYGKFVVVKHDNNLTTLYAHLSQIAAKVGETVRRGERIGYVGKSGYATGPHLHFTVYASSTFYMGGSRTCGPMPFGGYLNPKEYL